MKEQFGTINYPGGAAVQGGGGKKKMRGMEAIYLQRLEPAIGKQYPKRSKRGKEKARFRVCHDRVHDQPEVLAEDLTIHDELESIVSGNYKNLSMQGLGDLQGPYTAKAQEIQRIKRQQEKLTGKSSSLNSGDGWNSELEDESLNIFHGNFKQY